MSVHTFTRNQLNNGAWDINHPQRTEEDERGRTVQKHLSKEVKAALPGKKFTMKCDGDSVTFNFVNTLTSAQKTTLTQTVSDHQNNV